MAVLSTAQLVANAAANQADNSTQAIKAVHTREGDQNGAESAFNKVSDKNLVNLREYISGRQYEVGEGCMYDNGGGLFTWKANKDTVGVFNASDWDVVGGAAVGSSFQLDPANSNGLVLTGANPQILGLSPATASVPGSLLAADWAAFNAKQTALGFTPEDVGTKGVANGYTPLNSGGKIDLAFIPDSITGALNYKGSWNAATNIPAISDATGSKGDYYVTAVFGTQDLGDGPISFSIGDWAIHNGTKFERLENSQEGVNSVQGLTGPAVSLGTGTPGAMTVWAPNNVFKDSEINVFEKSIGLGVTPTIAGAIGIFLNDTGTGLSYYSRELNETELVARAGGQWISINKLTPSGERVFVCRGRMQIDNASGLNPSLSLPASLTTAPQIYLNPTGVVPTNPKNGEMWTTSTGLFYRHNGVTINLTTAAVSAKNGLKVDGGFVKMGGLLTENTTILGAFRAFRFEDLINFYVQSSVTQFGDD